MQSHRHAGDVVPDPGLPAHPRHFLHIDMADSDELQPGHSAAQRLQHDLDLFEPDAGIERIDEAIQPAAVAVALTAEQFHNLQKSSSVLTA